MTSHTQHPPRVYAPATLARVLAYTPLGPPGQRAGEIAREIGDLASTTVGQMMATLIRQGLVTCAGDVGKRRYWRVKGTWG